MKTIDTSLSVGDTVHISELSTFDVESAGSGIRLVGLQAASDGEEYVCLRESIDGHAEDIELPEGSIPLDVQEGSGMGSPKLWYLLPVEVYA